MRIGTTSAKSVGAGLLCAAAFVALAGSATGAQAQRFQRLDGLPNGLESPFDIQETRDGGYVVAGEVRLEPNNPGDMYVARHAADGTLLWVTRYGTPDRRDAAYSVQETMSGDFIVVGHTESGPFGLVLLRLDPTGTPIWSRSYRGDVFGEIAQPFVEGYIPQAAVRESRTGDIIAVGNLRTPTGGQLGVYLRTTGAGVPLINVAYPNSIYGPNSFDGFSDLKEDDNGSILITGFTTDQQPTPNGTFFPVSSDILTMRIGPGGGVIWAFRYGHPDPSHNEIGRGIDNLPLGDVIVGAATDQGLADDVARWGTLHVWTDGGGGGALLASHLTEGTLPRNSATRLLRSAEVITAGRDYGLFGAGLAGLATVLRLPPVIPMLVDVVKYGPSTDFGAEGITPTERTCGYALTGRERSAAGGLDDQWIAKANDKGDTGCFQERPPAMEVKPPMRLDAMFFTLDPNQESRPFGTELGYQMVRDVLCFDPCCDDCPADLTGDCVVDSGDLSAFITAFIAGLPSADLTGDGVVDSGDLSLFITLFLAGCP